MKYEKRVLATDMPKCYAIGMLDADDFAGFVVATEKSGPIRRFDLEGNAHENVCDGPGGVMTVMQTPGRRDQLIATCQFFSPNFGADDAKIVSYTRQEDGAWKRSVVCDLPYVHRFGVLTGADGQNWLFACTIKGACREGVKDDWLSPGAVYVAKLPERLEDCDEGHQLELTCLANNQLQNHGFHAAPDGSFALVGTAAGVFRYVPPASDSEGWTAQCLVVQPTSDMTLVDLDGDGKDEMVTISSFHGDTLSVWHETDIKDRFERVWTDPERRGFLHAIWSGALAGASCAVLGNRKDGRDLLSLRFEDGSYQVEPIDHDRGPANCWAFRDSEGVERIISANRETDEVALYTVRP